jgi:drug/metabolite transporter (DMT)-like permease
VKAGAPAAPGATEAGQVTAGIGLTVLAYFFFTGHDAIIKWLVAGLPVAQVLFFRSVFIVAVALALGRRALLARAVATPLKLRLLLRGAIILAAWLCYYTAARSLPLAQLTTIYFAAPVVMTLLAIPLLGERVTAWRWAGVGLGFTGVLIACRPAGVGLGVPVLLAATAACLWAYALILVRQIAREEGTLLQMLYSNGCFLAATAVMLLFLWQPVRPTEFGLLLAVGGLGALGQYSLFEAMRRAPASVLATFEYTALLWAFLLGFLIWGDLPRPEVAAGAGLIVLSGLLVVVTERSARR